LTSIYPLLKNHSIDCSLLLVILADDDESDRTNFTEALEESRIKTEVYAVKDGVELMEFLTREDTPVPHILFLDLNMPQKNDSPA
jgi:CheY-like chemotaxis protein